MWKIEPNIMGNGIIIITSLFYSFLCILSYISVWVYITINF